MAGKKKRLITGLLVSGFLCVIIVLSVLVIKSCPSVAVYDTLSESNDTDRYNVVIIGIDSLRWDHTVLKGPAVNGRSLTPNLERFSSRGTVFSNAITQAPWTLPAFASLFTGKYPHEHGAISLKGRLGENELTLAEILKEAGYCTMSVISHVYLGPKHGLGQGFDYLDDDNVVNIKAITSKGVTNSAIKFLKKHGDKNFFLFVHYFDPHYNYMNHSEWAFADSYSGWFKGENKNIKVIRRKLKALTHRDTQHFVDLYDEEIAYTDKQIGRLLDFFEKSGLAHKTLFVVLSDHGEEFMERGWVGHTTSLYEELIRVPMFVVLPGPRPQRPLDEDIVETRAIFTTVLDCLGLDSSLENTPESFLDKLSPYPETQQSKGDGKAFSTVWLPDEKGPKHVQLCALRTARWKLIRNYLNDKSFLYELSKDPAETENLFSVETETADKMSKELDDWYKQMMSGRSKAPEVQLSDEEIKKLKSLGYL